MLFISLSGLSWCVGLKKNKNKKSAVGEKRGVQSKVPTNNPVHYSFIICTGSNVVIKLPVLYLHYFESTQHEERETLGTKDNGRVLVVNGGGSKRCAISLGKICMFMELR